MPKRSASSRGAKVPEEKRVQRTQTRAACGFLDWLCRDIHGLVLQLLAARDLPFILSDASPFVDMALDDSMWRDRIAAKMLHSTLSVAEMVRMCASMTRFSSAHTRQRMLKIVCVRYRIGALKTAVITAMLDPGAIASKSRNDNENRMVAVAYDDPQKIPRTMASETLWQKYLSLALDMSRERTARALLGRRNARWHPTGAHLDSAANWTPALAVQIAKDLADESMVTMLTKKWILFGPQRVAWQMAQEFAFSQWSRAELFVAALDSSLIGRDGALTAQQEDFVRAFEPLAGELGEEQRSAIMVVLAEKGMNERYQRYAASGAYNRLDVGLEAYRHGRKELFLDAVGRLEGDAEHQKMALIVLGDWRDHGVDIVAMAMDQCGDFRRAVTSGAALLHMCCHNPCPVMYTLLRSRGAQFECLETALAKILITGPCDYDYAWLIALVEFQTSATMTNAACALVRTYDDRIESLERVVSTGLVGEDAVLRACLNDSRLKSRRVILKFHSHLLQ